MTTPITMKESYGSSFKDVVDSAKSSRYYLELLDLLTMFLQRNFEMVSVKDGENDISTKTIEEVAIAVCAVDEADLVMVTDDIHVMVCIVLGNPRGQLVSDYTINDKLEDAVKEYWNKWGL